ncbi:hypothetical protein DPMN_111645 [Dreissena polymorpha]|uniref:Uncharacterized protein n=1 Tax=Dreissena polymorpha TaxID=45954 RepID=A0A9D4KE89_DREPO|nr:hypothetical protein DPMN_111645 [Dreissena polymorpha]
MASSPLKGNYKDPKPDRSVITTTVHSIASIQGGCDKLTTGANRSIRFAIKRTTIGTWNV